MADGILARGEGKAQETIELKEGKIRLAEADHDLAVASKGGRG